MAKEIIARQLIISLGDSGNPIGAVLQYKTKENGILSQQFSSVSVFGTINFNNLNSVVGSALESAKKSEGIT